MFLEIGEALAEVEGGVFLEDQVLEEVQEGVIAVGASVEEEGGAIVDPDETVLEDGLGVPVEEGLSLCISIFNNSIFLKTFEQ